jgi:AAA+ ATPase superfamily predicted ATPase
MREEIRLRILKRVAALEKGYRQNVGLIGPEGSGKTRLLSSLFESLCGMPHLLPVYIYAPSFGYESLVDKWIHSALSGIFLSQSIQPPQTLESILSAAEPIAPKSVERIRNLKKVCRRERNSSLVRELFSLTGLLSEETGKKAILIIDEFPALEVLPAQDPFGILGKQIMLEKNTLYCFSSSNPKLANEIFREKLSLLFSNFEIFELSPLTSDQCIDYLHKQAPCALSHRQVLFLDDFTGGHPHYIDILLKRFNLLMPINSLLESAFDNEYGNGVLSRFYEAIKQEVFEPSGSLSLMFEKKLAELLPETRQRFLYQHILAALSQGSCRLSDLAALVDEKVSDIKKFIPRLIDQGIVSRSGSFYYLPDSLFQFWYREVYGRRHEWNALAVETKKLEFMNLLVERFEQFKENPDIHLESRFEQLLRTFESEWLEYEGKKIQCPGFDEITVHIGAGHRPILMARSKSARWACQILEQPAAEEDIHSFLKDLKQYTRQSLKKLIVPLGGIDQNAKLMAQEARIQQWDLKQLNFILKMYRLPKIMNLSRQEINEPIMGAVAQGLYTA